MLSTCSVRRFLSVASIITLALGAGLAPGQTLGGPVLIGSAGSQPAPASRPAGQSSRIRIDQPKYDFKQAWEGDALSHTFELVNTGSQPLTIKSVHTTCGCATTDKWEKVVAPGATWQVTANLDTDNRAGKLAKVVVVETDDPGQPRVTFTMEGEVRKRFEFAPTRAISFGATSRVAAARRSVTITTLYDKPIVLKDPAIDSKLLRASLREIEPGRKYELAIETIPPLQTGYIRGKITLQTDLKEQPELTLPVYAYVQPRVMLTPQTLLVPHPVNQDFRRALTLKSSDGTRIRLTKAEATNPEIQVELETVAEDQEYKIQVTVPAGMTLPPAGEKLTITTDNPDYPTFTAVLRAFQLRGNSDSRGGTRVAVPRRAATLPAGTPPADTQPAPSTQGE